jgi:hypothetical protein
VKDPNQKWVDRIVWAAIVAYCVLALSTCEPSDTYQGDSCVILGNGAEWGDCG